VPNSPGAADDAAGVAAALEVARALQAAGPHARDVIFLFTDGEEAGLLGADAFFKRDPLRGHVGVVVNMEARGDGGRAAMFQTGPDNGALMALYGRVARHPAANSLAAAVYARMPNDTDFTHAVRLGLPGLNFAFIDDQLAYHTPLATPDHLDPGSLQSLGDQVLPTVLALADAEALPAKAPDAIYSDALGLGLVRYGTSVGWGLIAAAALLVVFVAVRARQATSPWAVARGAGGLLLLTTAGALVLHLAGRLLAATDEQRLADLLVHFTPLLLGATALMVGIALAILMLQVRGGSRWWLTGLAVVAGGACSVIGGFDPVGLGLAGAVIVLAWASLCRPTGVWGAWIGALLALLALAATVQVLAPGGSVMLAWPLLAASLSAAAVASLGGRGGRAGAWILTGLTGLIAILVTAQLAAWGGWTFAGIGVTEPAVLAAFALLAAPALLPLAHDLAEGRWAWPGAALAAAVGVALIAYAGLAGGSAARPRLTEASYLEDLSAGAAYRVSPLPRLDAWSRAVLTAEGGEPNRTAYPPLYRRPVWMASAGAVGLPEPSLTVERNGDRLLIRAIPATASETLRVMLRPTLALGQPRLNGRPLTLATEAGQWSILSYSAPDPMGVTLSFTAAAPGAVEVVAVEVRDGWPAGVAAPPAKPAELMAFGLSDKTLVMTRGGLRW
ncbi:MAG: peptidase, partial [Caulobacter sp.]|nr:peptidase [Caulobacter sp.]